MAHGGRRRWRWRPGCSTAITRPGGAPALPVGPPVLVADDVPLPPDDLHGHPAAGSEPVALRDPVPVRSPASAAPQPALAIEWVSSEPQVATVDPDGRATALAAGAGEITARLDDHQDSVLLTVPRLTALAVSPTTATVAVGQSRTFTATGRYDDGSTRDVSELVERVSSDPRVAAVDPDGRAAALAAGAGEITARLDDEQDSALLTVGR